MSLDVNTEQLENWFDQVLKLLDQYFSGVGDRNAFGGYTPSQVRQRFDESLPLASMEMSELMKRVESDVIETATHNAGPHFYGYITGGGNQVGFLAEMIKAALNQNNLKWHSSPVSTELEKLVVRWIAEWIGFTPECSGTLLEGGSVANFEAMAVARKIMAEKNISEEGLFETTPMTVYVSSEGHSSFDKAMDILGLGKKYLRKIPVDNQFRINIEVLEKQIREDKNNGLQPISVIGIAGTTNTGAVDDLVGLSDMCSRYDLWFHVDAAYGGPAARVSSVSHLFKGIDRADSAVVNPHKWMYIPFEAAALLVKRPEDQRKTFSLIPDYLKSDDTDTARTDLMEYNLPLTKDFKALKIWMTIKAYGAERLTDAIDHDIQLTTYLAELVKKSDHFELVTPASLSILCFRFNPDLESEKELDVINKKIIGEIEADGRIFLTGTRVKGKTVLRVCLINHRRKKEDLHYFMGVIEEVGQLVVSGSTLKP